MLQDSIKKNERYLRFCAKVARFGGILLVILFVIYIIGTLSAVFLGYGHKEDLIKVWGSFYMMSSIIFAIFSVMFFFGAAQFIKYLLDIDYKPSWIIRNCDKLIYLFVIYNIFNNIHY